MQLGIQALAPLRQRLGRPLQVGAICLLATITAPDRVWDSAERASGETLAFSPFSLQLSQDSECHEQWCGACRMS